MFKSTDKLSGLFFAAFGLFTTIVTLSTLEVGTPGDMRSGFFPLIVGVLLVAVGLAVLAKAGLSQLQDTQPAFALRPLLIVTGAVVVSGVLLLTAGLIVAIPVLVILFSTAMPRRNWPEVLLTAIAMTVLSYLIFVVGLHLRIPLLNL
ncbi:tripartite tricarboxylate transporter TctB family protein [Ensifer sp. ENS05]|uniref:tripartite tricarboxylate transporter TctB family protein n=1 Tax=Ensifer sp. ENS05 TaxID=2769277 RepID=UPI001FEE5D5B|nr:tripartite tricarboxylate transporter TctB family protein [Ensifer sp. ENS05]